MDLPNRCAGLQRPRLARPARPHYATTALYRIDAYEHNVLAAWRGLGAPLYPTREQVSALRDGNGLVPAAPAAVTLRQDGEMTYAEFVLERPGVALLELG